MYGDNIQSKPQSYPGHNGIYVGEIEGSNGYGHYVVEALGWWYLWGKVEENLLTEFVNSSKGHIYRGAKTTKDEPDSERRENIVQIARDQVGDGYDNDFSDQKGSDSDDWTCVGLTEKAYESADTPDNLQYASSYGAGDQNYALDITPDGIDNNIFTTKVEMSTISFLGTRTIFFPYTQYKQDTLKDVITDLPVSDDFHTFTTPSKTTVSRGGSLGPFTVKESNNSSSYYSFYAQPYIVKPDGTTVNFKQVSTGLAAGKSRTHYHYWSIPSGAELGTFTFGAKLTDTSGNVIDDDSFEFTVVSGSTYVSKRSARRLKRLMRNPEAQVMEEEGWKVVIVPENDR
jgi:hypothetical protein